MNKIAKEFVRDTLIRNPNAEDFTTIYDAMCRAACSRSFHNLGYEELALAGVSFSLLDCNNLERLVLDVQQSMLSEQQDALIH